MADESPVSNHLSTRQAVCQYVRCVPQDLRAAFPFPRVHKSLGTRDARQARATALDLDKLWDRRFDEATRQRGLSVDAEGPGFCADRRSGVARSGGARHLVRRQPGRGGVPGTPGCAVNGIAMGRDPDLRHVPWRDDPVVWEHIPSVAASGCGGAEIGGVGQAGSRPALRAVPFAGDIRVPRREAERRPCCRHRLRTREKVSASVLSTRLEKMGSGKLGSSSLIEGWTLLPSSVRLV